MSEGMNKTYFVDEISKVIFAPFNSVFFYFTIVMIVVHKNNIHTTPIKILTLHFLLRAIGDSVDKVCYILIGENDLIFSSSLLWNIKFTALVFWYCGEMIGDFYLLSRTTPFIMSPFKNIRLVISYITYTLLALGKLFLIIFHFFYPYQKIIRYGSEYYNKYWDGCWNVQLYISFFSVLYDIVVYFTMKIDLFDRDIYSEIEENKAWKKYRKMSRLRIKYVAIFAVGNFMLVLITKISPLKNILPLGYLEYYRKILVTMPYVMLYIDQILISETDMIPINESIVHMNIYSH
ncbi:hypothetical protein BCR32DRAFT_292029 [Anaeromyces robustus]|uniref:G-protein coupled receptors family 1 profile domain-containing protein n=1 Tax=Anaeromyces robustus TaxID=1754192 RepID=A0A1Y1XCA7_9FUNG|nr:hypothetical protein BCR32DRAFT_292029 [Anaeromyces robustus]|eukprot:ORX83352.1 hypothetical protein BCR32DRAFT_292029 [Anaeromyces robustus]